MTEVWRRFASPNITPRDSKNYFRIVHRSFRTRNLIPQVSSHEESPNDEGCACRLCLVERERFSHIGKCWVIRKVFKNIVQLAARYGKQMKVTQGMIYLGVLDERTALTGALSDLHIILWKFVVIDMVKVDTEGARFDVKQVWRAAVRRWEARAEAARIALERKVARTLGLGNSPPPLEADCAAWDPILHFEYDEDYKVLTHYSAPYLELLAVAHASDE